MKYSTGVPNSLHMRQENMRVSTNNLQYTVDRRKTKRLFQICHIVAVAQTALAEDSPLPQITKGGPSTYGPQATATSASTPLSRRLQPPRPGKMLASRPFYRTSIDFYRIFKTNSIKNGLKQNFSIYFLQIFFGKILWNFQQERHALTLR